MAQNIGTLVTSAIRPNDSDDPIASAFASEIKGGLHTHTASTDRDAIILERRDWGMLCYVIDEDKTYQLKYNYVDGDIMNNLNWVEYSGSSGGGSNEWLDSVISIAYQPPATYSVGDRFLAGKSNNDSLLGDWGSFSPGVVLEWNSVSWIHTEPSNGTSVRVDDEHNAIYRYEGDFPNGIWYKEMLGQIRSMGATSNDGQSYTSSSLPPFDNYVKDMLFLTKFDTVNSGATVSININSMGSVPIRKPSSTGLINLVAGDIVPDITYSLVYNGSVFELIKHYTGDNALNIKYYIEPSDHVVVPPYHQYWVYGDLTIDGQMTNYGQVIIANGSLVNSNNFFNYGTVSFIQFNAGTASPIGGVNFEDSTTITFTQSIDGTYSAIINDDSLSVSKLQTDPSFGATAGYVLSNDGSGNFQWTNITIGGSTGLTQGVTQINSGIDQGVLYQSGTTLKQSNVFKFDEATGRFNINNVASPTAQINVKATSALSSDYFLRLRNSTDTLDVFTFANNGAITMRTSSSVAYWDFLNSSGQNVVQIGIANTNGSFRVGNNGNAAQFGANGSTDVRELSAGVYGKGKFGIGISPFAGTSTLPNEASTNILFFNTGVNPALNYASGYQQYSANNGTFHFPAFRLSDGKVVKLEPQDSTSIATLTDLVNTLINTGLLY